MTGGARQEDYSVLCAAAAAASRQNNYTPVTNFLFEDSLHLFAAEGANKDSGSLTMMTTTTTTTQAPCGLVLMKIKIKQVYNQTHFPAGNTETGVFFFPSLLMCFSLAVHVREGER